MSRSQQDTFIDDSEETCPLCIEEFDLSDKNFKPCPCGYQICQFCFNNIRQNMNGLCPACRRPYSDDTIEWKQVSAEEFKAEQQKKNRLHNERRMREAQKREYEQQNRKHLAGLRVVQKNLVYVTGLNPRIKEEDLLQTLRGEQYFGQYGKILKIVVNKRTTPDSYGHSKDQGMGVYVTFARKQDAATCIAAVDGSQNGDRILRATYGTTKYCSAYLRNEPCPNRNCMFLHEPGEEAESFNRQELSSMNAVQKGGSGHPSNSHNTHTLHHPPPQVQRTGSAISRTTNDDHHEGSSSSSALPPTVSWASKPAATPKTHPAVPVAQKENAAAPSPKVITIIPNKKPPTPAPAQASSSREEKPAARKPTPAQEHAPTPAESSKAGSSKPAPPVEKLAEAPAAPSAASSASPATPAAPAAAPTATPAQEPSPQRAATPPRTPTPPAPAVRKQTPPPLPENLKQLDSFLSAATDSKFAFVFSAEDIAIADTLSGEDLEAILATVPPLIDVQGGIKRRRFMEQERLEALEREKLKEQLLLQEQQRLQQQAQQQQDQQHQQQQQALQPEDAPRQGPALQMAPPRQQTPQQQAQLASLNSAQAGRQFNQQTQNIQQMLKGSLNQQLAAHGAFQQQDALTLLQQQNIRALTPNNNLAGIGLSNPLQQQFGIFNGQSSQPQGPLHTRQSSRYNFATDNATANAGNIKVAGNAQHMAQQQQMMPHTQQQAQQSIPAQFFNHNLGAQNVQAPPGLKTTTPPSGLGGLFGGQGGFGNLNVHNATSKADATNDLLQQLMGRRDKDLADPSIVQARMAPQQLNHQLHQHPIQLATGQAQQDEGTEPPLTPSKLPPGLPMPGARTGNNTPKLTPIGTPRPTPKASPKLSSEKLAGKKAEEVKGRGKAGTPRKEGPLAKSTNVAAASAPSEKTTPITTEENKSTESNSDVESIPFFVQKKGKNRPDPPRVNTNIPPLGDMANANTTATNSPATAASSPAPSSGHAKTLPPGRTTLRILSSTTVPTVSGTQPKQSVKKDIVVDNTRPSTPGGFSTVSTTDLISDTASVTSSARPLSPTAASPGGSRLLSAPPQTRIKSKSAMKKERQHEKKDKVKEIEEVAVVGKEEEHAPVQARAKKRKEKQKTTQSANNNANKAETAAAKEGMPPPPIPTEAKKKAEPEKPAADTPKAEKKETPVTEPGKTQQQEPAKPEEKHKDAQQTQKTASQLLAEWQTTGFINFNELEILKPVVGLNHRFEFTAQEMASYHPGQFSKRGSPTNENLPHDTGSRVYISPQGQKLYGLTPEQEKKFAELEARVLGGGGKKSVYKWNAPAKHDDIPKFAQNFKTAELAPYLEGIKRSLEAIISGGMMDGKLSADGTHHHHDIFVDGPYASSPSGSAAANPVDRAQDYIRHLTQLAKSYQLASKSSPGSTGAARVRPEEFELHDSFLAAMNITSKMPDFSDFSSALGVAIGLQVPGGGGAAGPHGEGARPSLEEQEKILGASRKECEGMEKRLNGLLKKNRKLAGWAVGS